MIYQPTENTGEYTTGVVYSEKYVKGLEQEIERLKVENKKHRKWIDSLNKDNHRLNNIIKEVREYIKETHYYSEVINEEYLLKSELERILDKENKE